MFDEDIEKIAEAVFQKIIKKNDEYANEIQIEYTTSDVEPLNKEILILKLTSLNDLRIYFEALEDYELAAIIKDELDHLKMDLLDL